MADDTSAAMIAQLDVKFDKLASNMKKAVTVFDDGGRKLEKRQAQVKKNLSNWALDFSGLGGLNKALVGLSAAAVVGGIGTLVKKSLDAASAIGDTAIQAGVSVERLQELRFAASQSGASFDIMDTALTTLNKSLGDFVNTGAGKGAAAFKQLGIDKLINSGGVRNAEDAFDAIAKGLQKFSSEAQKSSLLAGVFGKEAGPKLLQLMEQGTAGIAKLEAQAVSLGIVLSTDTVKAAKDANDKLDALGNVIKAQVTGAVANLAPEIANLADQITKSLPDLILWVEKWADFFGLIKISPVDKIRSQIADVQADLDGLIKKKAGNTWWKSILGLSDREFDQLIAADRAKLASLHADLALAPVQVSTNKFSPTSPILSVAQTAADKAAAQRAKDLADHRADLLAQTGADAKTAAAALLVAEDQTNVQLLKGSADYYAALQKQISDDYQLKVTTAEAEAAKQKEALGKKGQDWAGYAAGVANINAALTDKIAAAAEEQKQKLFENGPGALIQQAMIQANQAIQQYSDETDALGLTAGAAARLLFIQQQLADAREKQIPITKELVATINAEGDAVGNAAQANYDASQEMQANINIADNLRDGLVDVGTTALTQASNFKEAVGQMLLSLAQLIVKLELTKIAQDALGQSGTGLPGFLGSLFGDGISPVAVTASPLTGAYANGTNFAPGGMALVGERGPEIVNLPRGSQVVPNVPSLAARGGGGGATVIQQFDLRGAVVTEKLYDQMNATAAAHASAAVSRFSDKIMPSKVAQLTKNPRLR